MCSPRTANPTYEPPQRLCGREYFQLHTLGLQAPSFGLRHGRKCEICPTLTLSFLTWPRAVHEAKPGSERRILEGLKGSCGPPSRTWTDFLPMVPLWDTEGSLTYPHVSFFFFRSTSVYSCIKMDMPIGLCDVILWLESVQKNQDSLDSWKSGPALLDFSV